MIRTKGTLLVAVATLACSSGLPLAAEISLTPRGTYESGFFDESAAEIVDYDAKSQRLFVVNAYTDAIDVLDASDIDNPSLLFSIDLSAFGSPNSVAVDPRKGVQEIAVAVQADPVTEPGHVVFYDTDGNYLNHVQVGSLPDMLAYSPNGTTIAVANEGEPEDIEDYQDPNNPEGSISLIRVVRGGNQVSASDVTTIGFQSLNDGNAPAGLRLFPGAASVSRDLEPEYIAFSPDGRYAWATLQEANAVAIVDVRREKLLKVVPLGSSDHSIEGFGIDASDRDGAINIANWPVKGLFLPDSIASYKAKGSTYFVTANEGDDRDEPKRVKSVVLDPQAFPNASELQQDEALGRLNVSPIDGDIDGDGDLDELYSYGSRSFTIWDARGNVVFDSGDDFETITALLLPDYFNFSNDDNDLDELESRSDAKGPEPEAIAIGEIGPKTYAFIGLERIGGIMVYDITDPYDVEYIEYVNTRDFTVDAEESVAGDLGPEGLKFIPAKDSPTSEPLLVVANEVSGTTTIFQIEQQKGKRPGLGKGHEAFRRAKR